MKLISYPYRVYVIEENQPYENWFGDLLSYYPSSNFAEVENNKGEVFKLPLSTIFDADNISKNVKEVLI